MRIRYKLAKIDFQTMRDIFRHFRGHLKRHRGRLFMSTLSLLGVAAVTLLTPWPIKIVFDKVLLKSGGAATMDWLPNWSTMNILAVAAISVLAFAALKGVFNYSHAVLSKVVGHRLVADIRMQLFSHVQRLPQSYHDYRETGELMTRMTGDLSLLSDLLVSSVITLTSQLVMIIGMLVVLFWIDWTLALITLAVVPLFMIAAFRFSGRIKSSARRQREAYGKIVASVQESFAGIAHVKGYGQEKTREKLIGRAMDQDVKANVKTTRLTANYTRTVELISAGGTALVLWFGAQKALSGLITAGDLLIFLAYLRGMYRPLQGVARLTARIAKATVRGEKIIEILDMKPEVQDSADAISAQNVAGEMRFKDVSFSYKPDREVLHGLSCRLPARKTTLIIGPTGAGKSTVAKLLLRLYEPSGGTVHVDGRDIADYRIASLRKRISPLAQETFLFRTSIGENIAFGKRRAKQEAIESAARLVGIHEFIQQLPDGYDTLVGEAGLTLSGGQRQRIAFARAALRQSPIMIFDEPATGLDIHAEDSAKDVLATLKRDRTLIIITHRLHFLDLADWVVFVRDGRTIAEGVPGELIGSNDEFREFVSEAKSEGGDVIPMRIWKP